MPPFYTNNIYSLIHLIVEDPVKFPDNISPNFRSFLKGLLNKFPTERLTWPALQDHPFVRETLEEKGSRPMYPSHSINFIIHFSCYKVTLRIVRFAFRIPAQLMPQSKTTSRSPSAPNTPQQPLPPPLHPSHSSHPTHPPHSSHSVHPAHPSHPSVASHPYSKPQSPAHSPSDDRTNSLKRKPLPPITHPTATPTPTTVPAAVPVSYIYYKCCTAHLRNRFDLSAN